MANLHINGKVAVAGDLLINNKKAFQPSSNGMSRGNTGSFSYAYIPTESGTLLVQWGTTSSVGGEGSTTITIMPYNDTNFVGIAMCDRDSSSGSGMLGCYTYPAANNQLRIQKDYVNAGSNISTWVNWYTIGLV